PGSNRPRHRRLHLTPGHGSRAGQATTRSGRSTGPSQTTVDLPLDVALQVGSVYVLRPAEHGRADADVLADLKARVSSSRETRSKLTVNFEATSLVNLSMTDACHSAPDRIAYPVMNAPTEALPEQKWTPITVAQAHAISAMTDPALR